MTWRPKRRAHYFIQATMENQNDDDWDGEREKERHPFWQTRLERFL
jgi:hypothetical protein